MMRLSRYEKIRSVRRMEAVLLGSSAAGGVVAVLTLMRYGWIAGFGVALLTLIVFSLSQLFSLGCELLMAADQKVDSQVSESQGNNEKTA